MVNKPKAKGTQAEVLVRDHFIGAGFPDVHRSALSGIQDIGDLIGLGRVTIQVKNHATPKIPEWLRATEKQRQLAGNDFGLLVAKRQGVGARNVGNWAAIMVESQWMRLYWESGKTDLAFAGRGKSPSKALAWSMVPDEVQTLQFSKGVEVFTENGFENRCKIMSLDGMINLLALIPGTGFRMEVTATHG